MMTNTEKATWSMLRRPCWRFSYGCIYLDLEAVTYVGYTAKRQL